MILPPRRKPVKSGIERAPERVFRYHEKWVRGHACCVRECQQTHIEVHHVRSAATAGTALKPPSWRTVSLCSAHHSQLHAIGIDTFQRTYGIDLAALAGEFARRSPDVTMREAMREALANREDE
jgi:hypothetical protein